MTHPLAPRLATLALMAVLGCAGHASADDKRTEGLWLAANAGHSTPGSAWGRLVITHGMLTFHGTRATWTTPLSEIRRVSPSQGSAHGFEIVTRSGDVLRLSILGPHMVTVSPKKVMATIQRAMREVTVRQRTMAAATAPAGSGIR